MLCGGLEGRGAWGRVDTYISMAESLRCPPETITTLLISYIPIQNKKFFFKKRTVFKVLELIIIFFFSMSLLPI